ncbi:MAG: hypothetical protein OES24_21210 [Acidimicrobiia bacterium]|nr:hypothetical protein [Acidimicrobiia bacterium]
MNRSTRARWLNAAAFAFLAVALFVTSGPNLVERWIAPILLLAVAFVLSPLRPTSITAISQAEAAQLMELPAAEGRHTVIIYHRPGCTYCARLRLKLTGVKSNAHWVDIWADDAAAAYVRMVNDGNETVPTVVIDGVPHTNPNPSVVRAALT